MLTLCYFSLLASLSGSIRFCLPRLAEGLFLLAYMVEFNGVCASDAISYSFASIFDDYLGLDSNFTFLVFE